jgi:hypothetical protein
MITAMEECCSFGLRMVSVETADKYDCMIRAKVSMLINSYKGCVSFNVTTASNYPDTPFVVAASRMGFVSKPVWCYSKKPVDYSIFTTELASSNTEQARITFLVKFDNTKTIFGHLHDFGHFGCETF